MSERGRSGIERPIVLVGFMGSGKSSVGRLVADALGARFFDSDAVIEAEIKTTISALFAAGQESYFREIEAATIAHLLAARPAAVLALGGGAFERETTAELVLTEAVVVYLAVSWEELSGELAELADGRPLLAGRSLEDVHALFKRREPSYERAHLIVTTGRSGVDDAARAVLEGLRTSLD